MLVILREVLILPVCIDISEERTNFITVEPKLQNKKRKREQPVPKSGLDVCLFLTPHSQILNPEKTG
jgi:hypothetical protein